MLVAPLEGKSPSALPAFSTVWADAFPELSRPVAPQRTPAPRLLVLNEEIARDLDLDSDALRTDAGRRLLTGELLPEGSRAVAQVYAGHQWGEFRPILGDGRAALLGERRRASGALVDVHAKGIGPTEMARADGFATVGPMLREFLLGEAMHAFGVPTTRALAVVATGAPRTRDGVVLPGGVLTRVAASHIRYGTFEYAAARGDRGLLERLVDHTLRRHYPHLVARPDPARALLKGVVGAAAAQAARWMGLGFVHGVLSTDNVLVSGETIDYGPCAFLDAYDPDAVFSSLDRHGRYAYRRQPEIMRWNLSRLGDALAPMLAPDPDTGSRVAAEVVDTFDQHYRTAWTEVLRAKLGLAPGLTADVVHEVGDDALALLAAHRVDFTVFWRSLVAAARGDRSALRAAFPAHAVPAAEVWADRWHRLGPDSATMAATNPAVIPRNRIVDDVLSSAVGGDVALALELAGLLRTPFDDTDSPLARSLAAAPEPVAAPFVTFCGT